MNECVSVLQPVESAKGLPNGCYIDPVMFQIETEQISASDWAAIGFGFDEPFPGCVCPVYLLGIPLLLVRGRSGKIDVFENMCRHRGMILIEEAKKLSGSITCPYFTWAYNFDCTLRATPNLGGPNIHEHHSVDCTALSLNEIPSAI